MDREASEFRSCVTDAASQTVDEMTDQACKESNQRIAAERVRVPHTAKGQNKKEADEAFHYTRPDLPKTRSSRPYGKPEIQPITRPASGSRSQTRDGYDFDGEEVPRVRSDIL